MIVTADDLGLSAAVNGAIVEAFERGLITHASLMANMPSFDEACELIHERGLAGRIGVHLVLTAGVPLSEPLRRCRRFCDQDGDFFYWRGLDRMVHLSAYEQSLVMDEMREQALRARAAGLPVVHLDSHHHVHVKHALGPLARRLARELAIGRVRLAHNCGAAMSRSNRLYKHWYNQRLRRDGLAGSRWLGGIDDYRRMRDRLPAGELDRFEVVAHPTWHEGVLVDADTPGIALEERVP